jgi:hypothetical protein
MRTTRRGWSAPAVVVALDPGAAGAGRLGGFEHNAAGDTWHIRLWHRKDL